MAGGWSSDGNRGGCWGTRGEGENGWECVAPGVNALLRRYRRDLLLPPEGAFTPAQAGPDGWDESDHKDSAVGGSHTLSLECVHEEERRGGPWGHFRHYLHVGEGAGQGAST